MDIEDSFGPCMTALNERQRKFVRFYCDYPQASHTQLAKMAGYDHGTDLSQRQMGHKLTHDPKVIAAIQEELRKTYDGRGAAIALRSLMKVAMNDKHPGQLKAAIALADRSGFGPVSEQHVMVQHSDRTGQAMVERIKVLAKLLNLDAQALLGRSEPATIEAVLDGTGGSGSGEAGA